jgi:signal transduction histidine kinase
MFLRITLTIICIACSVSVFSQDLEKRLSDALIEKDSSESIFRREFQNLKTRLDSGIYFYYLGRFERFSGERRKAAQTLLKALDYLTLESKPDLYISSYNNLTYLESILGDWDKAMNFGQKALESATIAGDSNKIGYSLADIAIVFHDMEEYDKGVEYAKNGYEILKSFSKANPNTVSFALNAIAINFDDWNKPDSALFYHFKVFDLLTVLDSSEITNTYNNIGNTLLKQNKFEEARKWINVAKKYNYVRGSQYHLASNFTNLATIAYNLNDFQEAEAMMDSAYKYVVESESREKLRDYLYDQFRFQKKKGDLVKALDFLEEYASLKDTIFKEDRVRMIGEIQTLYEVDQKEKELAYSRAALAENELIVKNRNNQLLLLLVALLLILGVSFFIYYRQKNKTRHLEQESKLQTIYAEQETQKRLQEQRTRISSDLHDNIGAQLTFIVSSLNNIKFVDLPKDKLGAKIDQISAFTVETVSELRDTIWAMNKDAISVEDLQGRLAGLISKAKEACPEIEFKLEIEEGLSRDLQLGSLEGVNYFRIAQEALNNALKHAGATQIEIFVGKEGEDQISISVMDNGIGISQSRVLGNGLSNMRTRAERMGRELKVETQEGEGTLISVV